MSLRVLLADDQSVVREALKAFLTDEGIQVVGEAADGREAVRLTREIGPDVAVLDLVMPHLNGLDAAREILQAAPRMGVLILSSLSEEYQVVTALRIGIRGYVQKTEAAEELCQAIQKVAQGGTYLGLRVARVVEPYLH